MSSTTKGLSMSPPTHRIVQSIQISLHQSTDSTLSSLGSHSPLGTSYTPVKLNCLLSPSYISPLSYCSCCSLCRKYSSPSISNHLDPTQPSGPISNIISSMKPSRIVPTRRILCRGSAARLYNRKIVGSGGRPSFHLCSVKCQLGDFGHVM